MEKIIVPIDFSKQAAHAFDLALQLANTHKYQVTALHIVEFPAGGVIDPVGVVAPIYDKKFLDQIKKNGEEKMKDFLKQFDETERVEARVEIGNAYSGIADRLSEEDFDLIIMGTKGASGFREFFIGSNTEKVVCTAECPVIAVREKVDVKSIKNIAFAIGGPEASEDMMAHIKQLQALFNARLHMVRINTPNNFEQDVIMRPLLEKFAERHMLNNYTVNIFNDIYEDRGILNFANVINADMIAMGTHGRKGLDHLLAGSVAEDVVNHATKLMWTYHIKKD